VQQPPLLASQPGVPVLGPLHPGQEGAHLGAVLALATVDGAHLDHAVGQIAPQPVVLQQEGGRPGAEGAAAGEPPVGELGRPGGELGRS
jgi:hypothetical protein